MAVIRPFQGIRAQSGRASEVIAPPYDVLSEAEAREIAKEKPHSFIHVTRPEVALPPEATPTPKKPTPWRGHNSKGS